MGNQLIPNTNINKDPVGNCGVCCQWQLRQGVQTDKAKEPVSVFLYDKKMISKMPHPAKDEFLNLLKRDPQVLAKFKHHNILTVVTPLLEDPKRMGFVTEPVKTCLNILIDNNKFGDIVESELDIKLHVLELAETLSYLQKDVKAAHLSLSPENIYIAQDGKWKLGGFVFSTQILQGDSATTNADFSQGSGQVRLTPSLRFTAPEVTANPSRCTFTSDMFSLGCLIYTLYKIKQDNSTKDPYLIKANSLHAYNETIQNFGRLDFTPIPEYIRSVVLRMLHPDPSMRITASDFVSHSWFQDPLVQTVKCLETIHQRDMNQQTNFLKGLASIIFRFEIKFIKHRIIPILNNLLKNPQLASNVLPIYFSLMEKQNPPLITRDEFNTLIWPSIKVLVTGKEISAVTLFLLIQQMSLFVALLNIKEVEAVFVPILIKSLECGVQKIQDLAIKQSMVVFDKIDYNLLKTQILPKILNLCLDNNIDLRKAAIIMLSKTYQIFDTVVVNDQILSTLDKLRKFNNNYPINMAMLQIFQGISKDLGIEVIANKILISLIPMLVVQTLSKPEYKAFLSTVYAYLKRIEDEQNRRYEGKPDVPPEEAQPEPDKSSLQAPTLQSQPQTMDGKYSGDFSFLNSAVPKETTLAPVQQGEFDFSGFNQKNATTSAHASSLQKNNSLDTKPAFTSTSNWPGATQPSNTTNQKPAMVNPTNKSFDFNSGTAPKNDPFEAFSQNTQPVGQKQAAQPSGFEAFSNTTKTNPFSQGPATQQMKLIQGAKETTLRSQSIGGPAPQQNTTVSRPSAQQASAGFDAFQSFDQFGFGNQKQQQQQQPWNQSQGQQKTQPFSQQQFGFNTQWNQQSQQASKNQGLNQQSGNPNVGWDNLDSALESLPSINVNPIKASVQPPTTQPTTNVQAARQGSGQFGYGFDSHQAETKPVAPTVSTQQAIRGGSFQGGYSQGGFAQVEEKHEPAPPVVDNYYQQSSYHEDNTNNAPAYEPAREQEQPKEEEPPQKEEERRGPFGGYNPYRYIGPTLGLSAIRGDDRRKKKEAYDSD